MAFDVSSIVNAVNSYLYSISDVNKALTEQEEASKASGLGDLFQKILNKAVSDEKEAAVKDIDVSSALSSMVSSSTEDGGSKSVFDVTLPSTADSTASALSKLLGTDLSVSLDDAAADSILQKAKAISSGSRTKETASGNSSTDTFSEYEKGYDSLGIRAEIENNLNNHNLLGRIGDTLESMDIKGEIEQSIAEHNRVDEINSYNASRLSAYKNSSAKAASNSSVFGDFRL